MAQPTTILLDPSRHKSLIYSFASIHESCITQDHTIATFLPPLDKGKLVDFWLDVFSQAENRKTFVVAHLIPKSSATPQDTDSIDVDQYELGGYAYLQAKPTETGPFRAEVLKLLVSPEFRRRGIARMVMQKIDEVALKEGLTQLILDTEVGSPAEHVYPRLGYTPLGVMPADTISPKDRTLKDSLVFYKHLEGHGNSGEVYRGRGFRG